MYFLRSHNFFTCIFHINENQVYFSDSMKCPLKRPTPAKRIMKCRSTGTDTVSNVLNIVRGNFEGLVVCSIFQ